MSLVSVEVKHTTQLPARNNLKYVIKKIGDQSADKASDNDENDVERNEENKNVEESRQESFSSRVIKAVFCLM